MKKIIAVDVDDVISSQIRPLMDFANEKYDAGLVSEDFMRPGEYWTYYETLLSDDIEKARTIFNHYLRDGGPTKQLIDEDATKALQVLKKNYDLHIITSRGHDFREDTIKWISKELPNLFKGIHFVHLWDADDKKATKAMVCADIGAGYLIDDNAEHCNLAAEAGVNALLFGTFGWNIESEVHPNVKRLNNWNEVLEYFDGQQK